MQVLSLCRYYCLRTNVSYQTSLCLYRKMNTCCFPRSLSNNCAIFQPGTDGDVTRRGAADIDVDVAQQRRASAADAANVDRRQRRPPPAPHPSAAAATASGAARPRSSTHGRRHGPRELQVLLRAGKRPLRKGEILIRLRLCLVKVAHTPLLTPPHS